MSIFNVASKCLFLSALLFSNSAFSLAMWTDWTSASTIAGATGTLGGVIVNYAGEVDGAITNGTSSLWNPSTTYVGGVSDVSPGVVGDDIRLDGSRPIPSTISFSSTVVNPLFAIWSLGGFVPASFTFDATPTLVVGGPNSAFGGSSITVSGNSVIGQEGNGVVQFLGSFDSISFVSTFESFYAFTVGLAGEVAPPPPPPNGVPEAMPIVMLGLGLLGIGVAARRRSG